MSEDSIIKDWQYWTPSAAHCYKIDCKCERCDIPLIMETPCMMYFAVVSLYAKFGPPPKELYTHN